jgi:hypothetical protein
MKWGGCPGVGAPFLGVRIFVILFVHGVSQEVAPVCRYLLDRISRCERSGESGTRYGTAPKD